MGHFVRLRLIGRITYYVGWIALLATPGVAYPALVVPLVLAGVGVSMAMPAAQNAILSSVDVTEMCGNRGGRL